MRPQSIVHFDIVFFIIQATSIVVQALTWSQTLEQVTLSSGGAAPGAPIAAFVIGSAVVGYAINLLLWYFISRRASAVAKWIYTALFAIGVASLLLALGLGTFPAGLMGISAAALTLLNGVAVWLLFRADSAAWFRGQPAA